MRHAPSVGLALVRELVPSWLRTILRRVRLWHGERAALRRTATNGDVALNIGSGGKAIPGFISLDLNSLHYDAKRKHGDSVISYDMRKDALPFGDRTVSRIYASHVIEHIEDTFVRAFLEESWRVLVEGGVLRLVTPDAAFLHRISLFPNKFWTWRADAMREYGVDNPQAVDYLTREVNSALLFNGDRPKLLQGEFLHVMDALGRGATFDYDNSQRHINWFSYAKLEEFANGWSQIVESKHRGCIDPIMRTSFFDRTAPQMSLYVDLVK